VQCTEINVVCRNHRIILTSVPVFWAVETINCEEMSVYYWGEGGTFFGDLNNQQSGFHNRFVLCVIRMTVVRLKYAVYPKIYRFHSMRYFLLYYEPLHTVSKTVMQQYYRC
jgi:hypothetical protein